MSANGQETEAKFYVRDWGRLEARLRKMKARLVQARVLETNIRYDFPDGRLRAAGQVLRLRRDTESRYTFKNASTKEQGILSRQEIEFVVGDFEKAKQFLEALGYQKMIYYEKYRTTYELNQTLIMLDELPYGNFVEIEGEDIQSIQGVTDQLGLDWETAVAAGYVILFERVRKALKLPFDDISFSNFAGVRVEVTHLGVRAADRES